MSNPMWIWTNAREWLEMKVESNLKPENKFEIENIIDGKCDIVFFDNVQEIEAID